MSTGISRKGGKTGRKTIRAIKRKRYHDKFMREYGMDHKEWSKWKKTHTKEEVVEKREKARLRRV